MNKRFYPIVLHKTEWDRLKREGGPLIPETSAHDAREKYYDALNEQSQKWINLWPDSVEGVREKLNEQRRKHRQQNLALREWYKNSRKENDWQEAVKKAKQIIFDDSCYGRQLISAITESNILEEREIQIKVQKEIKQHEAEHQKNKKYNDSLLVSTMTEEEKKANRRQAALECVKFNEEMERTNKEKAAKLKADKVVCESVDKDMVEYVREFESKNEAEKKLLAKKQVEQYEDERKKIAEHRKISEDRDNALTAVYKKGQDRIKCKIDAVLKKVIEEKRQGERYQKFIKVIDEIQKAKAKRYNDFIEKGIKAEEQRYLKQEAKEIDIKNMKRAERYKTVEDNKIAAELHKLYIEHTSPSNKCACDVQTLLVKPDTKKKLLKKEKEDKVKPDPKKDEDCSKNTVEKESANEAKFSFLKPRNELIQALERRAKEPSGYTGGDSKDKYFAQQANDAFLRTKYKCFTRKVVDGYLKDNRLQASDLNISNY